MSALYGKVVVVSGGVGVLGSAVAEAALAAGARVARIDRAPAQADLPDGGVLNIGGVDLADDDAARAAVSGIIAAFGALDVVFNVAGAFEWRRVADAGGDLWLSLYRANVLTAAALTRAAIPHLAPGSTVLNIAATAADKAVAGMGPYAAAKAGVRRLTEALADELAPRGVWVASVSPTIIDTPRNRADMPKADPVGWLAPADLAALMISLAAGVGRPENGGDLRP